MEKKHLKNRERGRKRGKSKKKKGFRERDI